MKPEYTQDGRVVITQGEYNRLCESELKLQALEAAGVDNWQGYDFAMGQLAELKQQSETQ